MISDKTARALEILLLWASKNGAMPASWFGEDMWPDSPALQKHYRGGRGTTTGKGLWLSAGSYLRKLENRGLVEHSFSPDAGYSMTSAGESALREWKEQNPDKISYVKRKS